MNESPRQPSSPKKPYARPAVTEYGPLKDIVQGSTGKKSDGGVAGDTKPCWIAETLYGVHDPRTFLLRRWMTGIYDARGRGWQFVALYRRTGRVAASAIRATPVLGRGFRRVFDALLGKALRDLIVAKP
jgi:hypothetical protein